MARGKKNLTLSEQLEMLNTQIESMESELKELKNKKKMVEKTIVEEEMGELHAAIKQSGKTVKEILEMITTVD